MRISDWSSDVCSSDLFSLIAVAIGGIVEIAPLFWIDSTIEKVDGMRPYTPLELAGRNIYMREGCYTCHSQMIRPFRDEVERYGHYSLAAASMYDHPFRSEEPTSELQSLMRNSFSVLCLKKKKTNNT